jgi:hypothetical protein
MYNDTTFNVCCFIRIHHLSREFRPVPAPPIVPEESSGISVPSSALSVNLGRDKI